VLYPISAEDISVGDVVKPDIRAIGQTQGAGTPNAIGAGAFVPLHTTSDAVTYVDVKAKAHLDDRSGGSSIINTDVAGATLSTSTRIGYRWINDIGSWMYGVYGDNLLTTVQPQRQGDVLRLHDCWRLS
jgi:hypothetical protein